MGVDVSLLVFQILFWIFCVLKLWAKNRFYAIFCMVLYLYLLPTEITYRFYPSLFDAYWGPDTWYETYWFINLSLLALFVVLNRTSSSHRVYNVVNYKKRYSKKFIGFFVVSFSLVATYLFISNIAVISYQSLVANGAMGNEDTKLLIIDQIFKWVPTFVIFPLVAMTGKKWYMKFFVLYNLLLFFIYNVLAGSRSDILSVTLGLVLLWMYGRKIRLKQILILVTIAIGFLTMAGIAFKMRGGSNEGTLVEVLLKQDYTAPSYNLFGVIGKDIINPLMVIESQILKTFPLLGGEWIYKSIGGDIFPESDISASQGWAFHPFVEGYVFGGPLGFFYNGIVVGLGMAYWKRFISTNDKQFNRFMFAVIGSIFFALVRSQSVNFFRYIYFTFIPAAFIYSRLCNIEIHYLKFFSKSSKK